MPLLLYSWSQTKAKTRSRRPNCNPLVCGRASQLSELVSSSAMHWTLWGGERMVFKRSSFIGQLSLEASPQAQRLGSSGEQRVNTNSKIEQVGLEDDVKGQTQLEFSPSRKLSIFMPRSLSIDGCLLKAIAVLIFLQYIIFVFAILNLRLKCLMKITP